MAPSMGFHILLLSEAGLKIYYNNMALWMGHYLFQEFSARQVSTFIYKGQVDNSLVV